MRLSVLMLTHRLPYPPNRGDRLRSFHALRILAKRMDVELVSLVHDYDEEATADALRTMLDVRVTTVRAPFFRNRLAGAIAVGTSRRPLTHVLLDGPSM